MPLDLPEIPDLPRHVDRLVAQIPSGYVATYGDLAAALGNRVAARWVAEYLLRHAHSESCVCHRVIRATGEPGGYFAGGPRAKLQLLAAEGLAHERGRISLAPVRFHDFHSTGPLRNLLAWQDEASRHVELIAPNSEPRWVGGVDTCYLAHNRAIAAFALFDRRDGKLTWSTTLETEVRFPYISTYLTFRELPILLELLDQVRAAGRMPEVLLVDGSGLLHPRRAGLACSLGVVADIATVAVAKKRLCGSPTRPDLQPGES
ncbi:MAG: endonuclease V, partial [Planctomycetales bacterium]|nr:endonuclease V [Planctomycetales bacterium]